MVQRGPADGSIIAHNRQKRGIQRAIDRAGPRRQALIASTRSYWGVLGIVLSCLEEPVSQPVQQRADPGAARYAT
ncbi:hypothetical protein BH24CHL4_BH24CHL4_06930 [soil metagenome]